jgi:hypothetical protein
MPDFIREDVVVSLPAALDLISGPRAQRGVTLPSGPEVVVDALSPEQDELLRGLDRAGMEVVAVHVGPSPESSRDAARAPLPIEQPMTLHVPVEDGESAAVLVEQDGLYSWLTTPAQSSAPLLTTMRRSGNPAARVLTFQIGIAPKGAAGTRSLQTFLFGRITALIVRFVARAAAGAIVNKLDANVTPSLVRIAGSTITAWQNIESLAGLGLEGKAAPRILLFVHGTFSSTRGAFGALTATPYGKAFLDAALQQYDAVIGYDHRTLVEDPRENAVAMLAGLRSIKWSGTPELDVITHSRGGLVYRSLTELLIPSDAFRATFRNAIFVATPNGGTELARPENWQHLIDLYTNCTAMLFRVLSLVAPPVAPMASGFSETISIIGALVKGLADAATTASIAPGLAAQVPGGTFITNLNLENPGQPKPGTTFCSWIGSNFEANGAKPDEVPPRLWQSVADGVVDALMGNAPNDLVVDDKSMFAIDIATGGFIKDSYDFGRNASVYHTNYFTRSETVNALARWLRLQAPAAAAGAASATRTIARNLPANVDSDIVIANAGESAGEVRGTIESTAPSYVVLERWHGNEKLHYAYPAEELAARLAPDDDRSVLDALGLHEYMQSQYATPTDVVAMRPATDPEHRTIVFSGGEPVGVVADPPPALDPIQLLKMARTAAQPRTIEDRILARRAMPTFDPIGLKTVSSDPQTSAGVVFGAAPTPPAEQPKQFHFGAQMDSVVEVNKKVTLEVTIAADQIEVRDGATGASRTAPLTAGVPLIVEVFPRKNFSLQTSAREDIPYAAFRDPPVLRYFDVIPTQEGDGELWIVFRQGSAPLVRLVLQPKIVATVTKRGGAISADGSAPPAESSPSFDQLTVWENTQGNQTVLVFDLNGPSLGLMQRYTSRPFTGSREQYVLAVYGEIQNFWANNANDADNFLQDVRAYGMRLFDDLIPQPLQQILWDKRDNLKSIVIVSTEPFLPWELLHLHEPGKGLPPDVRFLAQMGVVRWLFGAYPPMKLLLRDEHVRYVIPNYPVEKYVLKNAETERQYLERKFKATAVTPQLAEVRKELQTPGAFDALHFSCHGSNDTNAADAQLMLEGRLENGIYYPALLKATVVKAFGSFAQDGSHPIVVLNACQVGESRNVLTSLGGFAEAFLSQGAGAFVAPLWSVGDAEASVFSINFYERLRAGDTLSEAAIAARDAARQPQPDGTPADASWISYTVYGHPHARAGE